MIKPSTAGLLTFTYAHSYLLYHSFARWLALLGQATEINHQTKTADFGVSTVLRTALQLCGVGSTRGQTSPPIYYLLSDRIKDVPFDHRQGTARCNTYCLYILRYTDRGSDRTSARARTCMFSLLPFQDLDSVYPSPFSVRLLPDTEDPRNGDMSVNYGGVVSYSEASIGRFALTVGILCAGHSRFSLWPPHIH